MNKQLFPSNQNAAVENRFCQHPLFPYLDFVCKPIAAESKDFALKTGELFYHCIFSLDTLKGASSQEQERKCIQLWADMVDYMRDKSLSTDNPEIIHAITLITYSVERCLLLTNNTRYTILAGQIQTLIQRYDAVFANQVRKGFNRAEQLINQQQLGDWLAQYMGSNEKLSDKIEATMELSRNVQPNQNEKPTKEELENVFMPFFTKSPECSMMVNFLRDEKAVVSDTDWARYALTIYRCKKIFRHHPESFKDWLPKFCSLLGRDVEYRAPSDLNRTKCKTDISSFLPKP